MTSSLVGSEMCIRDRSSSASVDEARRGASVSVCQDREELTSNVTCSWDCLLYTSDAADDM
eukprot:11729292-Prorocentrum_lima.AAC.1